MYYLPDEAPAAELPSGSLIRKPRPGSAYALASERPGIVAAYAEDDFGYIIRKSSTGEYHFIYFCAGKYDSGSIGYPSEAIASRNAYIDSKSRGLAGRDLPWLRELKLQSERLSEEELRGIEILGKRAEALRAQVAALASEAPSATEPTPRELAERRFSTSLVLIYGDDDRGYLIWKSVTGLYRFASYSGKTQKIGPGSATEMGALSAAHSDCQARVSYDLRRNWDWFFEMERDIVRGSTAKKKSKRNR